jgi:hypothetical protein
VVVADSRAARDGKFIEVIGHYNPLTEPPTIKIEVEKAQADQAQPEWWNRWRGRGPPREPSRRRDPMTGAPLVTIGEVLRPFGLRGEVKVRPLTDRPRERFKALMSCTLWEPQGDRREPCRIASCRFEGETVYLRMDGVDSPRRPALRPALAVPGGAREGTFYPRQLRARR